MSEPVRALASTLLRLMFLLEMEEREAERIVLLSGRMAWTSMGMDALLCRLFAPGSGWPRPCPGAAKAIVIDLVRQADAPDSFRRTIESMYGSAPLQDEDDGTF